MSDIPSSLRAYLVGKTTIAGAFGSRVFVLKVPDGVTYPFAVIRMVSDSPEYTQDGEAVRSTIMQVETYDDDLASAYSNKELIRAALTGHSGTMGSFTVGGVFVREEQSQWMTDGRHFKVFDQFVINWTV